MSQGARVSIKHRHGAIYSVRGIEWPNADHSLPTKVKIGISQEALDEIWNHPDFDDLFDALLMDAFDAGYGCRPSNVGDVERRDG